jgi:hypothetical protein
MLVATPTRLLERATAILFHTNFANRNELLNRWWAVTVSHEPDITRTRCRTFRPGHRDRPVCTSLPILAARLRVTNPPCQARSLGLRPWPLSRRSHTEVPRSGGFRLSRAASQRRFTAPWDIEDNGACFIVRDKKGQALAHCYYETEPGRRTAAGLLTCDKARRIAINMAKLPELLQKP